MNDSAATPCTLCTCPNCMAGYEAQAYQFEYLKREKLKALKEFGEVMNQINADWDARQADKTVEAPEFEVVEEPMNLGGKTYIIFEFY